MGPTALVVGVWLGLLTLASADPRDIFGRINALCTFGTAYDASLWRALPDGPAKQVLALEAKAHHNPYRAATRFTGSATPWNPPTSWRRMREVADDMVRAAPGSYVLARARNVPLVWLQPGWTRVFLYRSQRWVQWLELWQRGYRAAFYSSFPLLLALLAGATWNGFGWPGVVEAMRFIIAPYMAVVLLGTAALSLGSYEVGRLGISLHPFTALLWALALTRLWDLGAGIVVTPSCTARRAAAKVGA